MRRAMAPLVVLLIAMLAVIAAPAAVAQQPDGADLRTYQASGAAIVGSATQAGAPILTPGQYLDKIAPGEVKYYAIDVTEGTPYLAATMPGVAEKITPRVELSLLNPAGGACWTEQTIGDPAAQVPMITVEKAENKQISQNSTGGCTRSGRYYVRLTYTVREGTPTPALPLELLYVLEPVLAGAPPGPMPEAPVGLTRPPTPVQQIRGSRNFRDAPTLGSGTYQDTIREGETTYFRVPVGWGQRLQYDLHFGTEATAKLAHRRVSTKIYNPYRVELADVRGSEPDVLHVHGPTVDYANRSHADFKLLPSRLAGYHYIVVIAHRISTTKPADPNPVPIELVVNAVGAEQPGPSYVGGGPGGTPLPLSPAPSGPAQGAGLTTTAIVLSAGLGVAAVAAAITAIIFVRRYQVRAAKARSPAP